MAISVDSQSPDTTGTALDNLESTSWSISGSNRLLIGAIGTGDGTPVAHSGMKWGGSGGTALTAIHNPLNVGSFGRLSLWRLVAPAAASQTLYGNWAAGQSELSIGGVSFTGANQSTPVGTPQTHATNHGTVSSGSETVNLTTAVGDYCIAAFWIVDQGGGNPTWSPTGGASERYYVPGSALTYESLLITSLVATGTTTTMSASFTAAGSSGVDTGVVAVILNAAPLPSTFTLPSWPSLRPRPFGPGRGR